uniref:Uncharacterized protein n=1 Tax=Tanacetum cinerariifolium TaxID=118510 RepID=A0A6L2NK20_TANCI|nr:hypothetical protein [Tanacetum cinerariifolium]
MDTTTEQQVARDEALVPHAKRLRIRRSNFRLLLDIKSKESTLQLEFWATATVHHYSIRFKMDNKKHIVNLDSFREMLHICPRLPHQPFVEPPFEEEILTFLHFLRHSAVIKKLTHVEQKDIKKSNKMYYPLFTKVIIHHFMLKDPSIPRRNKVNWHYVRDDHIFSTIKLVSKHQNTQQFGALLPIELTNEDIRNSNAYKEYYVVATGVTPPKRKASLRKTKSSFDTTINPATVATGPRLSTSAKDKQPAKASKAKSLSALSDVAMTEAQQLMLATKRSLQQTHISQASGSGADEETGSIPGVLDVPTDVSEEEISWNSTDEKVMMMKERNKDEGQEEEEEADELHRDVNINLGRVIHLSDVHTTQEVEDSLVTLTPVNLDGQQQSSFVSSQFVTMAPLPMSAPTITPSTIATITTTQQATIPPTTAPSTLLQDLPNFGSLFGFDHRIKTLEANFSDFMQTNQFAGASDRLRDKAQANNDEFLKTIDENMQKTIKEQVKEQVKVQVSKILPKIKETVNEKLEAEVLTRSSNSSKTSYVVAVDLSEMELKKILIEKIEGNKSIHRSNEQRNLYKAHVKAYESDKIILDTYGDTVTLKRCRDDDTDKDEEPSARSDRGSKRCREGKEPESASAPTEKATRSTTFEMEEPLHPEFDTGTNDQPFIESSQHPKWFSQQKKPPTPDRDWNKTLLATHRRIQPWISELTKQFNSRFTFNKLMDTPMDFSNFLMNRLKVDTLTPELLAGPTYELMKGSCKSLVELEFLLEEVYKATTDQLDWVNPEGQQYPHNLLKPLPLILNNRGRRVIPFDHFINNDLEYLRGGASSRTRTYTTSVTKTNAADYGHIKWIKDLFYAFAVNRESARDVYSKRKITAVTELKIVEWHNYKYLDWITVQTDDDKLYKFKEGDFKRLRIQDIEYIVKSYQKQLNLTKLNTYRCDLKRKEAYIAYSNPRGFIYQNKDKKNRLMRIDELHKFSDGTLTDVRTALDDRLKGIRMKYLPQSIWRKSDKDRAAAMIQAIDKRLKTMRIMRSLERFIGGRLYEGNFRMLQRTT